MKDDDDDDSFLKKKWKMLPVLNVVNSTLTWWWLAVERIFLFSSCPFGHGLVTLAFYYGNLSILFPVEFIAHRAIEHEVEKDRNQGMNQGNQRMSSRSEWVSAVMIPWVNPSL